MDSSQLRQIADRLANSGAVLTTWNSPVAHYLVGEFRWLERNAFFWFAANGDATADGHVLRFESVESRAGRLHFHANGKVVGILAPIDEADVDDRDDYRVAWSIWQQVAPVRRHVIEEARAVCQAE